MTAMAILPGRRPDELGRPSLDRILCAVDGSRGSAEAVHGALALAPCATRLCFIAVADVAAEGCERVALDDSPAASALVGLAGSIAAGCRGYVHLVHVQGPGYGSQTRHRLAELSTELIEQTGSEPVVEVARGANVPAHVCQLARDSDSSLVVVGRRGRLGPRGLGPVGEPILHGATCSVLVVPTTGT